MTRGILSFLDDNLVLYPFDASFQPKHPSLRKRSRGVRSRRVSRQEHISLRGLSPSIVLLFLFDSTQTHSLHLRNRIVELLRRSPGGHDDLICIAVGEYDDEFLANTGFFVTKNNDRLNLLWRRTPSLVVVHGGRRISVDHEECALEWNAADTSIERWQQGLSALSTSQYVFATALNPSCTIL